MNLYWMSTVVITLNSTFRGLPETVFLVIMYLAGKHGEETAPDMTWSEAGLHDEDILHDKKVSQDYKFRRQYYDGCS